MLPPLHDFELFECVLVLHRLALGTSAHNAAHIAD